MLLLVFCFYFSYADVWIISDGRNYGASRFIGRLLAETRRKSKPGDVDSDNDDDDWLASRPSDPVLIGVSHWGSLKRKKLLGGISVSHILLAFWRTFAICYRPSIVCLSVTFVMHRLRPTQPVEIFGSVSSPSRTLATHWHSPKILWRSSQGNHSVVGFKRERGSQI